MQVPTVLPQSAKGTADGGTAPPTASSGRGGLSGDQAGSGFLSVLETASTAETSESALSTPTAADTSEDSVNDVVPEAMALALSLAGAILGDSSQNQQAGTTGNQPKTRQGEVQIDAAGAPESRQEGALPMLQDPDSEALHQQGVQEANEQAAMLSVTADGSVPQDVPSGRAKEQSAASSAGSKDGETAQSTRDAMLVIGQEQPKTGGTGVGTSSTVNVPNLQQPASPESGAAMPTQTADVVPSHEASTPLADAHNTADSVTASLMSEKQPATGKESKDLTGTAEITPKAAESPDIAASMRNASPQDDTGAGTQDGETAFHSKQELPSFASSRTDEPFGIQLTPAAQHGVPGAGAVPSPPAPSPQAQLASSQPSGVSPDAGSVHGSSAQSVVLDLPQTDLGQLRVRVVLADQTVHAHLTTERGDLGQMLASRQDQLGSQLSSVGLELGQMRVQVDRQNHHQAGGQDWFSHAYDDRGQQQRGQSQQDRQQAETPLRQQLRQTALSIFA
ncbi:hypothetical protein W02_19520 [Nitrospira sp. KM1]|uniref:flagellar hook-length control protein FliK n=1 Tax=Nitrospira sp. KM1 TaxID=1936990 RepID=UPI0013A7A562|nr:flagellar hook-length control protein FliK [Nitrospira sp. KM1]BCA54812.1 hypothetical protein W02_19520 [Nitrospira sp. KM1]